MERSLSSTEMQACLARLYTDDTFRNLFYLHEDSLLDQYVLTDDEQVAIKAVDRKMLDFFASSLKKKRKKKFHSTYRAFFSLDNKIIDLCYDRYYQLYPARPNVSHQAEVLQFGQFIEETLAGIDTLAPYIRELVRYEYLIASMDSAAVKGDSNHYKNKVQEMSFDQKPLLREGVHIESFTYDVATMYQALLNDEELLEGTRDQYSILFQNHSQQGSRFFSISKATKMLLDLCDGGATLKDVISTLQARYGDNSLGNVIHTMVNRMLELGVIEVNSHE